MNEIDRSRKACLGILEDDLFRGLLCFSTAHKTESSFFLEYEKMDEKASKALQEFLKVKDRRLLFSGICKHFRIKKP